MNNEEIADMGDALIEMQCKEIAQAIYEYDGNLYRVAITKRVAVSSIIWWIENDKSFNCSRAYKASMNDLLADAWDHVVRRVKNGDGDMVRWFIDKFGEGGMV